jgi:hypothetical protein
MPDFTLYALNDFAKLVKAKVIDPDTGAVTDETEATVTAFLATSDAPDAIEADASLKVTPCPFVAAKKGFLVFFDRTILTAALLDGLFATTPPVLIIDDGAGWRVAFYGEYLPTRPGTVQ